MPYYPPSGGATPTGNANTIAIYDNSGDLATTDQLTWTDSQGSITAGLESSGASIVAQADGQLVGGRADGGTIRADVASTGALVHGYASTSSSLIEAQDPGATALGRAGINGSLISSGNASLVHGFASGNLINPASITASGDGSAAIGVVSGANTSITASGTASLALGNITTTTNSISASGVSSVAIGIGHAVSGDYATSLGQDNLNSSYASLAIGRFGDASGTTSSWVDTDPAFLIGKGTDSSNRADAYRVDKDGRVSTFGSHRNERIRPFPNGEIVERTDRMIMCATTGGAVTVNLPAGERGLELIVKDRDGNAGTNAITINAAGGDSIEGSAFAGTINSAYGCRHFIYDNVTTTWYLISRIG